MLLGKTLRNRYKIISVLGSGGFGDTYLAQDMDLPSHPTCVVKQLKPKDTSPNVLPIAKSLFDREAEYLYKLGNAHPQIPNLFAHFEENNEFFLVQEFIEGHSLADEIPIGARLSEPATINLLLEILEVLCFVHQHNVIHRDIKLTNIMRRQQDGKVVLIDFGAVKDVSALKTDSQGNTNVTVSIGSPGYMPSEQAMGKPQLSSDVYAVGMIGLQALTGIAPDSLQEDPNTGEIVWRDRVQVSDAFAEVLQNMVFYRFSQRYKSAIEAFHAMQSLSATNINSSANNQSMGILPTQAIAPPIGAPTVPVAAPTTPQVPATTPHVTVSAPSSSNFPFQPLIWLGLTALISVGAAIATAMLLPKLTNRIAEPTSTIEAPKSPTNSPIPTSSPSDLPSTPPIASPSDLPTRKPSPPIATIPNPPVIESSNNPNAAVYGAIARSPSTQTKGYSWNYSSRKAAETRALSECENTSNTGDCKILIWSSNACMAIAESSNGAAGSGWSEDRDVAETTAKRVCREYQGINCTVTKTICLPVQQ